MIRTPGEILEIAKRTVPGDTASVIRSFGEGFTEDIIRSIRDVLPSAMSQTAAFAETLKYACGGNISDTLYSLYHFLCVCVPLKVDPMGVQYIRKPAAIIHSKNRCADCKSYSIFIASVLRNLGIPCRLKFCSWAPDDVDVRHVFVQAYPDTGKAVTLDVNLKSYNKEKSPNYHNRYIDMTKIYSIGDAETSTNVTKSNTLLDGRRLNKMPLVELDLRIFRENLRAEKSAVSGICGIGSDQAAVYSDAIDMTNDTIGEVMDIFDNQHFDNAEDKIASIGYDYMTGKYSLSGIGVGSFFSLIRKMKKRVGKKSAAPLMAIKTATVLSPNAMQSVVNTNNTHPFFARRRGRNARFMNRIKLATARKVRRRAGVRHTIGELMQMDSSIGSFFRKVCKHVKKGIKAVKKGVQTSAKVVANTTKKVAKSTVNVVKNTTKMTGNLIKASALAPAALFSSKARANLKKTMRSAGNNMKDVAKATKDLLLAPFSAAIEEIIDNYMPKVGPYFLYTYIDDKTASKLSAKVQNKRKKQQHVKKLLVNGLGVDSKRLDKMIRASIMSKMKKTPEAAVSDMMKGISGVGLIEDVVKIVSMALSLLNSIMSVFSKNGKGSEKVSADSAPSSTDFNTDSSASGPVKYLTTANTLANAAASVTNSTGNQTFFQKLTGGAKSLVKSASNVLDNVIDNGGTITTSDTDALTSKEVDKEGNFKKNTDSDTEGETTTDAPTGTNVISPAAAKSSNKMLYIGAGVIGLGILGMMMMKKKH